MTWWCAPVFQHGISTSEVIRKHPGSRRKQAQRLKHCLRKSFTTFAHLKIHINIALKYSNHWLWMHNRRFCFHELLESKITCTLWRTRTKVFMSKLKTRVVICLNGHELWTTPEEVLSQGSGSSLSQWENNDSSCCRATLPMTAWGGTEAIFLTRLTIF